MRVVSSIRVVAGWQRLTVGKDERTGEAETKNGTEGIVRIEPKEWIAAISMY